MAKERSKVIVIDASVARAAGPEQAVHPTAKLCRDFLEAVRKICHRIAWTPELRDEWKEHMSGFSRRWLVSMVARKKMVQVSLQDISGITDKILQTASDGKSRDAMEKDLLLLRAALAADKRIASLDDKICNLFQMASSDVGEIRDVIWINPTNAQIDHKKWLENGAPASPTMTLGRKKQV